MHPAVRRSDGLQRRLENVVLGVENAESETDLVASYPAVARDAVGLRETHRNAKQEIASDRSARDRRADLDRQRVAAASRYRCATGGAIGGQHIAHLRDAGSDGVVLEVGHQSDDRLSLLGRCARSRDDREGET